MQRKAKIIRALAEVQKETVIKDQGRPSHYDADFIQRMLNVMNEGGELPEVLHAIGISRATFFRWLNNYPEFKEAYDYGKVASEVWWRNLGKVGMVNPKEFNGNLYTAFMNRRFWKDIKKNESTGPTINIGTLNVQKVKHLSKEELTEDFQDRISRLQEANPDILNQLLGKITKDDSK